MFWGFIRHDGYRLLLRCPEPFTSSDYLIFLEIAKTAMIGRNFIFQDDNCPVHRSHAVQEWFLQCTKNHLAPLQPGPKPNRKCMGLCEKESENLGNLGKRCMGDMEFNPSNLYRITFLFYAP